MRTRHGLGGGHAVYAAILGQQGSTFGFGAFCITIFGLVFNNLCPQNTRRVGVFAFGKAAQGGFFLSGSPQVSGLSDGVQDDILRVCRQRYAEVGAFGVEIEARRRAVLLHLPNDGRYARIAPFGQTQLLKKIAHSAVAIGCWRHPSAHDKVFGQNARHWVRVADAFHAVGVEVNFYWLCAGIVTAVVRGIHHCLLHSGIRKCYKAHGFGLARQLLRQLARDGLQKAQDFSNWLMNRAGEVLFLDHTPAGLIAKLGHFCPGASEVFVGSKGEEQQAYVRWRMVVVDAAYDAQAQAVFQQALSGLCQLAAHIYEKFPDKAVF